MGYFNKFHYVFYIEKFYQYCLHAEGTFLDKMISLNKIRTQVRVDYITISVWKYSIKNPFTFIT